MAGLCFPLRKQENTPRAMRALEWLFSGESKTRKLQNSISARLLKSQARKRLAETGQRAVKVKGIETGKDIKK